MVAHLVAVVVTASHVYVVMVMTMVHSGDDYMGLSSGGNRMAMATTTAKSC